MCLYSQGFYLTEPTSEFKLEENKVLEYQAVRSQIRKQWDTILSSLMSRDRAEDIEADLQALTKLLRDLQDIPIGVKKTDLVKTIRGKKFDPTSTKRKKAVMSYWTTPVEMAYQDLIRIWDKNASPDAVVTVY